MSPRWLLLAIAAGVDALGYLPVGHERHAIITQGNAYLTAHTIARGLAIGGKLCDGTAGRPGDDATQASEIAASYDGFGNYGGGSPFGDPFGSSSSPAEELNGPTVASYCPSSNGCTSSVNLFDSSPCACHPSDYGSTSSRYAGGACDLPNPVSAWTDSHFTMKWSERVTRSPLDTVYKWSDFEALASEAMFGTTEHGGFTQYMHRLEPPSA